jgi:hypothetical protein
MWVIEATARIWMIWGGEKVIDQHFPIGAAESRPTHLRNRQCPRITFGQHERSGSTAVLAPIPKSEAEFGDIEKKQKTLLPRKILMRGPLFVAGAGIEPATPRL